MRMRRGERRRVGRRREGRARGVYLLVGRVV